MSKTAFLFAGQGAYRPGMFAQESGDPDIDRVLDAVDATGVEFGRPATREHLLDPAAPTATELSATDPFTLQLLVFAAAVGEYHRAARVDHPDVLVGHSLGELAALTVAGAFELADATRLVCHRSVALDACVTEPGGMLAIDLPADRAAHLVGAIGDRRVAVVLHNSPARTVVAGPDPALTAARQVADALGVRSAQLPAPYAYHSPGMALAAVEFAESAAPIRQKPLRSQVYSPLLGKYLDDTDDLVALLVAHLTTPIDFVTAIRTLHAHGLRTVVECGRSGLGALVLASVPDVNVRGAVEISAPAAPTSPEVTAEPAPAASDLADVTERLRVLYATALQYPLEAVEPDADLEAELGIDSLKRSEMLGRVGTEFDIPPSTNDSRFLAHTTLAELAAMVVDSLDVEATTR
ncbi:acyltransferase domain-containing protein [Actinophytocola sp.]|uniref:acyltransferase domain-containing protein n=1 Tax=Actinophytocola sp. TaxID=1872138 RepID=UPI003D6A2197